MSDDRLILPRRPQQHKRRFIAAMVVCGLIVTGVWGWQMKMTYERYTAARAAAVDSQALTPVGESLNLNAEADSIKTSVNELKVLMEAMARQEVAKEQLRQEVAEGLQAEINGNAEATPAVDETAATTPSLPVTENSDTASVN